MAMPMKKSFPIKKHPRPNLKAFAPAKTKGKQTRKAGKPALKPFVGKASAASANVSPAAPARPSSPNAADIALAQLQRGNKG